MRVRQAVGYGVDRDAIVNIALNGLVQVAPCTVGPGILGGNSDVCQSAGFTHDPDKAKELLKAAGYGDKKVAVTLATWTGGNREQVAQLVQTQQAHTIRAFPFVHFIACKCCLDTPKSPASETNRLMEELAYSLDTQFARQTKPGYRSTPPAKYILALVAIFVCFAI